MRLSAKRLRRRGVAAVEMAFVMPFLLLLLTGVWELGRIIHVQTIMNAAVRDSARLAAQANIVNTTGSYTQIKFDTGTPNVKKSFENYLKASNIDTTGMTFELQFLEGPTPSDPVPTATNADPYTGVKNQRFRIRASIPYDNVRWTTMSLINPTTLYAETTWQCLVDDPFTLNTTMPGWSP
jgi:Flp pilus assembly protein TadG